MTDKTTIKITKELAKLLQEKGSMSDTYESVIRRLLEGEKE